MDLSRHFLGMGGRKEESSYTKAVSRLPQDGGTDLKTAALSLKWLQPEDMFNKHLTSEVLCCYCDCV